MWKIGLLIAIAWLIFIVRVAGVFRHRPGLIAVFYVYALFLTAVVLAALGMAVGFFLALSEQPGFAIIRFCIAGWAS